MRGRKPKPTQLKELEGNPGKRRLNASEPHPPVPDVVPYAPKFLNEDARDEWNRMIKILLGLGLYTEIDHAALAMYCQAWGRWVETEKQLSDIGNVLESDKGNFYQNPLLEISNRAWSNVLRAAVEFGMTPSSRSRVHATSQQDEPSMAELLFGMATGKNVHVGGMVQDDDDEGA